MNSVMCRILEYWSRDLEVQSKWQREPVFEGPLTEVYEPADIVSEVLTALSSGETAIRVVCTSNPNRYDLAGRVTAAIAEKGHVLVAFAGYLHIVARKMLDGLVPEQTIGHVQQPRSITLAPFERLSEVLLDTIATIVVLAGTSPHEKVIQEVREAQDELWHQTKNWLESAAASRVLIEFKLAGRRVALEKPGVVIDGWQTVVRTK